MSSTLITTFFKSPPHRGDEEEASTAIDCCSSGPVPVEDRLPVGDHRPGVLPGLPVVNGSLTRAHVPIPRNCPLTLENGTETHDPPSAAGPGAIQGTLAWDTSSGKLTLRKPPATIESEEEAVEGRQGSEGEVQDVVGLATSVAVEKERGAVNGVLGRRRKSRRETDKSIDYLDESPAASSDELTEQQQQGGRRGRRRRRQREDQLWLPTGVERESSRGRAKLVRSDVAKRELIVQIQRCHLKPAGAGLEESREVVTISSQSEPNSENETCSSMEPGLAERLEESVEIVSASTPPRKPALVKSVSLPSPQPHPPSSASLSGAWAKIFSQPVRQKSAGWRSGDSAVETLTAVRGTLTRSPKRRRRSASCSPKRTTVPRSPGSHRSPRRGSPLRSPLKVPSAPASPLRASLKARKTLVFSQPVAKRRRLELDHAPFTGLVHVRQESSDEPLWTLTPSLPVFKATETIPTETPAASSLGGIVNREVPSSLRARGPLAPIEVGQREAILEQLAAAHRQERVGHIFQRYCRIKNSNDQEHPPFGALLSEQQQRVNRRQRMRREKPLLCSVHILDHETGAVTVDAGVYSSSCGTGRRKSLRLTRKRSASQDGESTPRELRGREGKLRRREDGGRGHGAGGRTAEPVPEDGVRERPGEGRLVSADLWSEVYRPQCSAEVIGNRAGVQQLHSWLQTWRNKCSNRQNVSDEFPKPVEKRCGNRERRKLSDWNGVQPRGSRGSSPTPEWVHREGSEDFMSLAHLRRRKRVLWQTHSSESEGEEGGEREERREGEVVSSVLLLCGKEGCGKTAAVYACAAELGFKVFEINSSAVRGRGSLLATLKEATLSHQVSTQPKTQTHGSITSSFKQPLREPASASAGSGSAGGRGRGAAQGQASASAGSGSAGGRGRGAAQGQGKGGLFSFFKPQDIVREDKAAGRREGRSLVASTDSSRGDSAHSANERNKNSSPVSLATATVILLEEVDILFDSDRGFWSGVYEVIETTRRPIILTCNDSRCELDCDHIKITFDPPSLVELGLHVQLLCLSHDCHMTSEAALQLAGALHADIRRLFLSLQFWTVATSHTPSPSMYHIAGLPAQQRCRDTENMTGGHSPTSLPPLLSLPWRPSFLAPPHRPSHLTPPHRPSPISGLRELDAVAHCAEQHAYLDLVAMETGSVDDVTRPWWACPEEASSVLDELPVRECVWEEEEVRCGVCEEVERGVGRVRSDSRDDAMFWTEFNKQAGSVRGCLQRCAEVFGPHSSRVGVATDGLPLLRAICLTEASRQTSHTKRRFRHYLQSCVVDQSDLRTLPITARFSTSQK